MLKFSIIVTVILLVHWYPTNGAKNTTGITIADKLDFWKRDPKFDYERAYDSPNDNLIDGRRKKIHYKHHVDRYTRRSSANFRSSNASKPDYEGTYSDKSRVQDFGLHHIKSKDQKNQKSKEFRGMWPRQKKRQRNKKKEDENDAAQSTRLTPAYLMQQTEAVKLTTTSIRPLLESGDKWRKLNPYDIQNQMERILASFVDVNSTIEVLGLTAEYKKIVLIKMSSQKTDIGKYFRAEESKYIEEVPSKKIIFIVHGLSVIGMKRLPALYVQGSFTKLLGYYVEHLDKYDIFLMPLANPDGFMHTINTDCFWNKNVSPQSNCAGVALDRNFDVAWSSGKAHNPCSQMYEGPKAFSEAETRAIRDVMHHFGQKIHAYIHVHAGSLSAEVFKGDAVLYPKGYTEAQSDDDKYIDLRGEIDEALKNASFQVITVPVETLHNWYGRVTGSSVDYASSIYGIPYALEFVMQIYEVPSGITESEEDLQNNALTEIWRRVIDVVFNNMWKNLQNNELK